MKMTGGRYFSATALAGRLFVEGVSETEGWNPDRLTYRDEADVNYTFNERTGDRKAGTIEELKEILQESHRRGLPILKVWIGEGLEDAAHREWKISRRGANEPTR